MTVQEILALAVTLQNVIVQTSATVKRLRDIAEQEGATPEQLAELDGRLTDAIARREAERAAAGPGPTP